MAHSVSVIVPVYGSSHYLFELDERIRKALLGSDLVADFEIIYVNDVSPHGALPYLKEILSTRPGVVVVDLMKNVGQLKATVSGIEHASGELIVTIDDDLQQHPEEIPILLAVLVEGDLDLVVARFEKPQHSFLRRLGSKCARFLAVRYLRVRSDVEFSSFCVMRRAVYSNFFNDSRREPVPGWMYRTTSRYGSATVQHSRRPAGKSTYSLSQLLHASLPFFSVISDLVLKFLVGIGLVLVTTSLAGIMYLLFRYSRGELTSPGYTSTVLLLLANLGFTGSLVSFCALYLQSMKRMFVGFPHSFVRSVSKS